MKSVFSFFFVIFILSISSCKNDNSNNSKDDELCSGSYQFLITDTLQRPVNIQFPHDTLLAEHYIPDNSGRSFCVRFSVAKDTVYLMNDSIIGVIDVTNDVTHTYSLENTFAGGRFVVWYNMTPMSAEYTVYGSGLPVILSERGNLIWRD